MEPLRIQQMMGLISIRNMQTYYVRLLKQLAMFGNRCVLNFMQNYYVMILGLKGPNIQLRICSY